MAPITGPFGLGDSRLLENLYGVLVGNNVSAETSQEIISDLLAKLSSPQDIATVEHVRDVTSRCKLCPAMAHDAKAPSWNTKDPKTIFVLSHPDVLNATGLKLFIDILSTNGFSSENCAITYVTRCTKNGPVTEEEISNCTGLYLFTELQAMKPNLIVPVGSIPTKVFFGSDAKVTEINEICWFGPWAVLPMPNPNPTPHQQGTDKAIALIKDAATTAATFLGQKSN